GRLGRGLAAAALPAGVGAVRALTGVLGIALQVPVAAVIPAAGVAVEEAVLLAVHVVAQDPGREARLVVVRRARALWVKAVDFAVAIVVDAVGALRPTWHALAVAVAVAVAIAIAVAVAVAVAIAVAVAV